METVPRRRFFKCSLPPIAEHFVYRAAIAERYKGKYLGSISLPQQDQAAQTASDSSSGGKRAENAQLPPLQADRTHVHLQGRDSNMQQVCYIHCCSSHPDVVNWNVARADSKDIQVGRSLNSFVLIDPLLHVCARDSPHIAMRRRRRDQLLNSHDRAPARHAA